MAENCRFEDNYVDLGLGFGTINVPLWRCQVPASNKVWGESAGNPASAVVQLAELGSRDGATPIKLNVGTVPEMESCKVGEIDDGLACRTDLKCTQLNNDPTNLFNFWNFKTECSGPSIRWKQRTCPPGRVLKDGLCYE